MNRDLESPAAGGDAMRFRLGMWLHRLADRVLGYEYTAHGRAFSDGWHAASRDYAEREAS